MKKASIKELVKQQKRIELLQLIESMYETPVDLKKLQRKFSPYLKTARSSSGKVLSLSNKNTAKGVLIVCDSPNYYKIYSSYNQQRLYHAADMYIYAETSKELISKLVMKYELL